MNEFIHKVKRAIDQSISQGALKSSEVLSGFSGQTLLGTLQRLSAEFTNEDQVYVEVGVYQGLSLLSVASVAKGKAYGIDNFAFFDPDSQNFDLVKDRMSRLKLQNVEIINSDFEEALLNLDKYIGNRKVAVYFVDGPHDYRSQLLCLLYIKPYLAEQAVILVDDSNYLHVRQANADFIQAEKDFFLAFEAYTASHPKNMPTSEKKKAENGWWDGINILVKDRISEENKHLPKLPVKPDFTMDHTVHSSRNPDRVAEWINYISGMRRFNFFDWLILWKKISIPRKGGLKGKYSSMNTFSADLPSNRYHPLLLKE